MLLGVTQNDLGEFKLRYSGDYKAVIAARRGTLLGEIKKLMEGPEDRDSEARSLTRIRKQICDLQKEIGGDEGKAKKLVALHKWLKESRQEHSKLDAELNHADGAPARIETAQATRLDRYLQVFEELERQRPALAGLYKPLEQNLANGLPDSQKLSFYVRQLVDVESWAARGEELLDLRRKTDFREPGSLLTMARELLGTPWQRGDAESIRSGMAKLVEVFKDAKQYLRPTSTLSEFATWLFSTDHVRITYGIRYEGKEIQHLSPGTRGIVLLILYLCLDSADERPLIIDQPEENLDPKSVHEVLTVYFRECRQRRQVILVTHNANLVVNTDSDQVIIASAEPSAAGGLPSFSYLSGGLENSEIREQVCEILEGGQAAFLLRGKRYGLKLAPIV